MCVCDIIVAHRQPSSLSVAEVVEPLSTYPLIFVFKMSLDDELGLNMTCVISINYVDNFKCIRIWYAERNSLVKRRSIVDEVGRSSMLFDCAAAALPWRSISLEFLRIIQCNDLRPYRARS